MSPNYSNMGSEIDDFGELGSGYVPPPLSAYGADGGSAPSLGGGGGPMVDVEGRRKRHKEAVILGWISGFLAFLVAVGGSFFWYTGLQNVNVGDRGDTNTLSGQFVAGQTAYNKASYAEAYTIMYGIIMTDTAGTLPEARLYAFASAANQADREITIEKNFKKAAETYKTAVTAAINYKIRNLGVTTANNRKPTLPPNVLTFDDWEKKVTDASAKLQKYVVAQEADTQTANLDDKTKAQALGAVITKWDELYQLDPTFLIEDIDNGVAERLIKAYLDRAKSTCNTTEPPIGLSYVDMADKVANDTKIKGRLSGPFKNQIAETRKDVDWNKCSN